MNYKYQAIIFDFDDTLIGAASTGIIFHQKVAESQGWRVPPREEIIQYWGLAWEMFIARLWPEVPFSTFRDVYIKYSKKHPRKYRLIRGVKRILKKFKKQNFILGILSNRNEQSVRDILERFKVDLDYFDFIWGEEAHLYPKPDPRAFNEILSLLGQKGILPQEIIYVGDTKFDIQACKGNKIKFLGVLSGLMRREEFKTRGIQNEDIISSIRDLPRWLKRYGELIKR